MNSIKLNYTFLIFTIISINSFGQSINFSAKGGLNISNTKFSVIKHGVSSNRDYDNRMSFYIGGGLDFPILSKNDFKLRMQVELLYSREGTTRKFPSSDYTRILNLDQIKLPILLKKKLFNQLDLLGGGYVGYIIDVQEDTGTGGLRSIKNYYTDFDLGVIMGIEYHFNLGIFIESRYNYGLADVSVIEFPNSAIEHSYKNRLFQLGIGYKF